MPTPSPSASQSKPAEDWKASLETVFSLFAVSMALLLGATSRGSESSQSRDAPCLFVSKDYPLLLTQHPHQWDEVPVKDSDEGMDSDLERTLDDALAEYKGF